MLAAADVPYRRIYDARHTFASGSIHGDMSMFHVSRMMGCSVQVIDAHYAHLLPNSEEYLRGLLNDYDAAETATGDVYGLSAD